ncbi:MAG: Crp/Fnr family transcriptional regulator [Flavisolibacter sp.]
MIEKMLAAFNRLHALTDEMRERLTTITSIKEYPKKHLLLQEGQVAHYAYFVVKGLARAYYITDGKEITTRFMNEDFIITSWISFYTRQPGYEFIETLEDCVLAAMHYRDLQKIYSDIVEFNIVGRKLAEHFFFLSEQRTQMLRKHTADEKYTGFLHQHPDLLQRIPLKYIATYLGMNEETLSRVRSKAAKPKN